MSKDTPDHHDADLVLRLYELRRETVMRDARDTIKPSSGRGPSRTSSR